jgi:hypothetical protein
MPDKYVGHTTNFVQRKYAHKRSSHTESSVNYHMKLYQVIRDNGGWDNWKMEVIQFYDCENQYEARVKEQEHYVELKATLNSIEPLKSLPPMVIPSKLETYACETCDYTCVNKNSFDRHLASSKHKNKTTVPVTDVLEHSPDTAVVNTVNKYICKKCEYTTNRRQNWDKHEITSKHLNEQTTITYTCGSCDFHTSKLCHWNEHLRTKKTYRVNSNRRASRQIHVPEM